MKRRPVALSILCIYCLFQTVRPALYFFDLAVSLLEELIKGGWESFKSAASAAFFSRTQIFLLLKTIATLVVGVGLWRMRFWSLFVFDALIAFQLWGRIIDKNYSPLPLLLDIILLFIPWYGFAIIGCGNVSKKQPEKESKVRVETSQDEEKAKNPVDDIIY